MTTLPAGGRNEPRSPDYTAWVNVVLGMVVFILRYDSPRPSFEVHRNLFLTGIVITFAAFAAVIAHDGSSTKNYWSAIDAAAGVWLVISSQTIPSTAALVTQSQLILGVLIFILALASLAMEIATRGRAPKDRTGTTDVESLSR
jgi:predicted membrane channel-forming protein YqfA (hemolysin III family)